MKNKKNIEALNRVSGGLNAHFEGDVNANITAVDSTYYEHDLQDIQKVQFNKKDEQNKFRVG